MQKVRVYGEFCYLIGTRGSNAVLYYQGKEMIAPLADVVYLEEE